MCFVRPLRIHHNHNHRNMWLKRKPHLRKQTKRQVWSRLFYAAHGYETFKSKTFFSLPPLYKNVNRLLRTLKNWQSRQK